MDQAALTLQAAERLYAAAVAPHEWPQAIAALLEPFRAEAAFLAAQRNGGPGLLTIHIGAAPADMARVMSAEGQRIAAPVDAAVPIGRPVTITELLPEREWERSAYYNELVRPIGTFYGMMLRQENGALGFSFALCRARRAGNFGAAEMRLMQGLVPHLARALELHRRLGAAEGRAADLARALDRLDAAVVLTDAVARPVFVNAATARFDRAGLRIAPSGIAADTPAATARLRAAIAAVANTPLGEGVWLRLERRGQRTPLLLRLMPLSAEVVAPGAGGPRVAIFIREPDVLPAIDRHAVAEIFGLTPRESEVAQLVGCGLDPAAVAVRLGLGIGTVRNHLKRVFDKTDVHSRAALVALIRSAPGAGD
ncbi:MAG TPA: helix-turn-helix transcriptional regulator [Thermomicrobiales bacterium]|nr:helix-turn-helix transcriptional regulator [Thermomicrobiales bacterium]